MRIIHLPQLLWNHRRRSVLAPTYKSLDRVPSMSGDVSSKYWDLKATFLNLPESFCTRKQATRNNVVTSRGGGINTRSQQVAPHFLEIPVLFKVLLTGSNSSCVTSHCPKELRNRVTSRNVSHCTVKSYRSECRKKKKKTFYLQGAGGTSDTAADGDKDTSTEWSKLPRKPSLSHWHQNTGWMKYPKEKKKRKKEKIWLCLILNTFISDW